LNSCSCARVQTMNSCWPRATFCDLGPPSRWRRFSFSTSCKGISAPAPKCTLCVVSCAAGIRSLPDTAPMRSINTWLLRFDRRGGNAGLRGAASSGADRRWVRVRGAPGYLRRLLGTIPIRANLLDGRHVAPKLRKMKRFSTRRCPCQHRRAYETRDFRRSRGKEAG
jgi:hypothetical protein